MKEIQLTTGKVALVDDDDYEYLNQFKWYIMKNRNRYYAMKKIYQNGQQTAMLMHRLIMNTPSGMDTDHIDMNGLNNQKSNLRVCTRSQNMYNTNKNTNTSSKYRGVYLLGPNRWQVKISVNHKSIYLGMYKTEIEAAIKYDEAAIKNRGEFARLNFPDMRSEILKRLKGE